MNIYIITVNYGDTLPTRTMITSLKECKEIDDVKTIIKRYDTYMKITEPVLNYYSLDSNFKEVDGSLKIDEISSKIDDLLRV